MQDSPNRARIRVLVADDTRIHTELLVGTLRCDNSLEVGAWNCEADRLLAQSGPHDCDVLLISSHLEEQPRRGLDVLRAVRSANPEIRAVVLLGSSRNELVLEAFRAGARGVFSKQESIDTLGKCIRCVHQGQIWAGSREMSLAIAALASSPQVHAVDVDGLSRLSKRELEVVRSLAEGLSNREIAERLGLSQHTVKNYLFKVFDKLGVSSRVELLFMTLSQGATERLDLTDLLAGTNQASFAFWKKAAEEGSLPAQLALAQLYLARQSDPQNLIRAYMWYLIATEHLSATKKKANQAMHPEQLIEAERLAAEWLRRAQRIDPASIENPVARPQATRFTRALLA